MFDFKAHLENDEKILYQGRPVPGKGAKSIVGSIIIFAFIGIIQLIIIWYLISVSGTEDFLRELLFLSPFILVTLFFDGIGIYNIVYNYFVKKAVIADDYYCLTTKRVMKYESKKDKLVYGYLINYSNIKVSNVKDNFGDIGFNIVLDENTPGVEDLSVVDVMLNPNPTNMPSITFESIENPEQVLSLAYEAKKDIERDLK